MIFGQINSIDKFTDFLPPVVHQLLQKLKSGDFFSLQKGRHEYSGEDIYISADEYCTQCSQERKYEYHQKYVDLQYLVEGEEKIYLSSLDVANLKSLETNINETILGNDCWFVDGVSDDSSILLKAGDFLIILPNTLHKPCCSNLQKMNVRKLVFKIDRRIFER